MFSRIVIGELTHGRKLPVEHTFTYPFFCYCFDLDELSDLSRTLPLFGYNKFRIASVYDADYLDAGPQSIKEKVLSRLKMAGCSDPIARVELVTSPRYFNYIFNPVSFYFCFDTQGQQRYHVAEINNTFSERHPYVLGGPSIPNQGASHNLPAHYRFKKEFFVSPFNPPIGEYDVHFGDITQRLDVRFNLIENGTPTFVSRMAGEFFPLTTSQQLKTLLRFPFSAALTMPRIFWQAQKLRFSKKLPMLWKPDPRSKDTMKS